MGKTISSLSVKLDGNVEGFKSELLKGEKSVDHFADHLKESASRVTEIASALGMVDSLEGLKEYIGKTLETAEASVHLAQTLGMTTMELGQLQYSAALAGVSAEEVSGGMAKMSKNLFEATDKSSNAGKALAALGLDAQSLINLKTEDAFGRISDALKDVDNPMQRMAMAQEILGRGAASLMPLILKGSDALDEQAKAATASGYALGQMDSEKLAGIAESMNELSLKSQGAANTLMVELAPALQAVAGGLGWLVDHRKEIEDTIANIAFGGALSDTVLDKLLGKRADVDRVEVLRIKADALKDLAHQQTPAMGDYEKQLQRVSAALDGMHKSIDTFGMSEGQKKLFDLANTPGITHDQLADATASAAQLDAMTQQKKLSEEMAKSVQAYDQSQMDDVQKLMRHWEDLGATISQALKMTDIDRATKAVAANAKAAEEADKNWQRFADTLKSQADQVFESTRTAAEKLDEQMDKLDNLKSFGAISDDTFDRARQKLLAGQRHDDQPAQLLQSGSEEAAQYISRLHMSRNGESAQNDMIKEQREGNKTANMMLESLKKGLQVTFDQISAL